MVEAIEVPVPVPAFQHNLLLGKGPNGDVWVGVLYQYERNHKWELSFTGVVGPYNWGNCRGSCGQIVDHLLTDITIYAEGWSEESVTELVTLWKRWHLNGMRAGSLRQEAHLRTLSYDRARDGDHYNWARNVLAHAGLHPDASVEGKAEDGYRYGESWLYEEIPHDVLAKVFSLPVATKACPWGSA